MLHFTTELECILHICVGAVGDMDYGMVHISSHAHVRIHVDMQRGIVCCNDHNGRTCGCFSKLQNHHHNSRISS